MNQTQKRLSIIKLAISIGDTETIQLQILKLAPLKTDERIQEILRGLQSENYAQTQALITEYLETPTEEILQRTSQRETLTPEEEEEIIEEFDLFKVQPEKKEKEIEEILDIESFKPASQEQKPQNDINYDSLLNLKSNDILADNIAIEETSLSQKDDFFDLEESQQTYNYTEVIEKDDFFHTASEKEAKEEEKEKTLQSDELLWENSTIEEPLSPHPAKTDGTTRQEKPEQVFPAEKNISTGKEKEDSSSALAALKKKRMEEPSTYEAITYIDQKLKNMMTQYPPLELPEENYPSVDAWLLKISNEGYTEKEVEEVISHVRKLLKEEDRKAEAAQLLLISAATQSKFAQFMLARSLFKGDLLEQNLPEAFTLINRLAMDDDYAEAICDLGQFYEYGIGIDKDKKRAEQLYKEAMELGIKRAKSHYERLHKENRGFFSFFKKQ